MISRGRLFWVAIVLAPSIAYAFHGSSIQIPKGTTSDITFQLHAAVTNEQSPPSDDDPSSDLQRKLQAQTLSRITIPSIACATLCYASFPTITMGIQTAIHDAFDGANTGYGYEALNLILTDNSNQFIQNVHNFLALMFSFLAGNTLFFLYRNQEKLYFALFEEISALTSLLEQSALLAEGRDTYRILLDCISRYVEDDLKLVTDYKTINGETSTSVLSFVLDDLDFAREDLPALILSRRPKHDPLETILYVTSVGEPNRIYSTVRELRKARAKRLGALQRKMPEVNMYLLYVLGFTVWISFPVVAAGSQTVGGDALLELFRAQLSVGIFAMAGLLGIINELKRPEVASAYNVDYSLLRKLIGGIENDLQVRMKRHQEMVARQSATVNARRDLDGEKPIKRLFGRKRKTIPKSSSLESK